MSIEDSVLSVLSNLIHIIAREIFSEEDAKNLLPGEFGIQYDTGVMYFKNPRTGIVITPNRTEAIMQFIAARYDSFTGLLSSDSVGGLRVYTSIGALSLTEETFTFDLFHTKADDVSMLILPIIKGSSLNSTLPNSTGGILTVVKMIDSMKLDFVDMDNFKFSSFYNINATPKLKPWTSGNGGGGGAFVFEADGTGNYTASCPEIDNLYEGITIEILFKGKNSDSDITTLTLNNLGLVELKMLNKDGNPISLIKNMISPYQYAKFRKRNGELILVTSGEGGANGGVAVVVSADQPSDPTALWYQILGQLPFPATINIVTNNVTTSVEV